MRYAHGLVALLLAAVSPAVSAQKVPLWEVGFGAAVIALPDYRGADEGHTYILPVPYVVYNGDLVQVDRRGVRGDLFHSDRVQLDLSLNLGPPAKSGENAARMGMPDLDPTFEFGPALDVRLWENAARNEVLAFRLPARAVVATDFSHFDHIGWVFAPHLNMDFLNLGPGGGWNLGLSAGPVYATTAYHAYYYAVRPEFATPTRPVYEARGGYSGLRATISLSKRFQRFWVGSFARYDDLHDVAFEDSPLVRRRHSFMAGVGISWIFVRSAEVVERKELRSDPR